MTFLFKIEKKSFMNLYTFTYKKKLLMIFHFFFAVEFFFDFYEINKTCLCIYNDAVFICLNHLVSLSFMTFIIKIHHSKNLYYKSCIVCIIYNIMYYNDMYACCLMCF